MRFNENYRRGITALELLLMISVLSVLVAVIVPGVMKARDVSRANQCKSRLRQIGVAIHGYESAHNSLPPLSRSATSGRVNRSDDHVSAHARLLPYLDQDDLASKVDVLGKIENAALPSAIADSDVRRVAMVPVTVFRCPADDGNGLNNFVFCTGSEAVARVDPVSRFWGDGPFPLINAMPLSQIRDGLSNTAAVSERLTGYKENGIFDPDRDSWYSGVESVYLNHWPIDTDKLQAICDQASPDAASTYAYGGWSWLYNRYNTACYNHVSLPNSKHTDCSTMSPPPAGGPQSLHGIFRATSNHGQAVHTLLLDGSVRVFSATADRSVYRSFATRAGESAL